MNTTQSVALRIDESALFKNLKFAFSNSFTVITELLQNGRRAGATKIDIQTSEIEGEHVFTITDDGCGLSDFQKLLTLAESGWDEHTKANESPFGMGFASALFAARRVIVESNGYTLDMDTEHLLSMNDVQIKPVSDFTGQGTRVTLFGMKADDIGKKKISVLVKGFPIPVTLNAEMLERPYALGTRTFVQTDIGLVYFDPQRLIASQTSTHMLFLQGIRVQEGYSDCIVHLDPTKYFGRMPDRNTLVNEKEARASVDLSINNMLFNWCEQQLASMGGIYLQKPMARVFSNFFLRC